jgi:hypothetical protein
MSLNLLIKKNLDILLISIDSLDPYILDSIVFNNKSSILDLFSLFKVRTKNCMRYQQSMHISKVCTTLKIIQQISKILLSVDLQNNIQIILQEHIDSHYYTISELTNNYFNRFEINYRKSMKPYLSGFANYNDSSKIRHLGLINLYILYKMNSPQGINLLLLYLIIKI